MDQAVSARPDFRQRAVVRLHLACYLAWGQGEVDNGERLCHEALQLFEEVGDSGGALFAEEQLAFIEYLARGFKVGAARAEQVIRRARGSGDVAALARANRALATFQSGMNDPAAEATLRASLSAHRRAGRQRLATIDACNLSILLVGGGRGEEALALLEETRSASPDWRTTQTGLLIRWLAGDYAAALDWARQAQILNPEPLSPRHGIGLATAALCAVELDDLALAGRYVQGAQSAFRNRSWALFSALGTLAEGVLAHHEGRAQPALQALRTATTRLVEWGAPPFAANALIEMAEVACGHGVVASAAEAADRLRDLAAATDVSVLAGHAHLGQAWCCAATADRAGAAHAARSAVEVFTTFTAYLGANTLPASAILFLLEDISSL